MGEMIGIGEVAEILGVHRQTVSAWVKSGKLTPAWTTPTGRAKFHRHVIESMVGGKAGNKESK